MFSPEQVYYEKVLGVRREHTTNLFAVTILVGLCNLYAKKTGLEVTGYAPAAYGARFYFFNHLDNLDVFRLNSTSFKHTRGEDGEKTLGRIPRALAKSTFFGIPEPSKVRERTNKKDILNSDNPLINALVRLTIGSILYGNGFIPIRRGMADRAAEAEINKALSLHQVVASAANETRDKTGGLKGLRTGPAFLVKTHPDIPFQLVGVSPNRVNVGQVHTYTEIKQQRGDLNLRDLTMLIADGIIELLPERVQERWRLEERQAAYQSLYPKRVQEVTPNT